MKGKRTRVPEWFAAELARLARGVRLEAGMTQQDVARRMGRSCVWVSQLECRSRTPSLETAVAWARALGCYVTSAPGEGS